MTAVILKLDGGRTIEEIPGNEQDTDAASAYHEATKLAYINLGNKPPLYKTYSALPIIPLPTDFPSPEAPTLEAVAGVDAGLGATLGVDREEGIVEPSKADGPGEGGEEPNGGTASESQTKDGVPDLTSVAQLLFFSAGLIRKAILESSGEVHYRAAASAGALFPIDVYLVCQDINGLEAGVYHFSPQEFALRPLRKGDYRAELVAATGEDQNFATAPVIFIYTATFWRSAWKYRARGYRYCFWDCGTMLANLLALCSALSLPARLVAGFVDQRVDTLLRIRGEREGSICLVPVGTGADSPPALDRVEPAPLAADLIAASDGQIEYPEARRVHLASCLATEEEVVDWRAASSGIHPEQGEKDSAGFMGLFEGGTPTSASLGEVIKRRGSTRRFAREEISRAQLEGILSSATRGIASDFREPEGAGLLDVYIIVNAVTGLSSGSYLFSSESMRLELLRQGDFREQAGHLCFEQALGADASVVAFFMADLEAVFRRYGNRGYRAAQLEAGVLGGKVYLCAHSLGLGASGMTFYDDDVTEFFSPHAAGKSVMFLVATGVGGRPNRVRPFRSQVAVTLDSLARGAIRRPTSGR